MINKNTNTFSVKQNNQNFEAPILISREIDIKKNGIV